jgi:hypothetical protein
LSGGGCVCVCIYLYLYLYENWKPRRFSLIHLPFAHQRKLSVCKQTKQTYPSLLIGICVLSPPPRPTPTPMPSSPQPNGNTTTSSELSQKACCSW